MTFISGHKEMRSCSVKKKRFQRRGHDSISGIVHTFIYLFIYFYKERHSQEQPKMCRQNEDRRDCCEEKLCFLIRPRLT